MTPIEREAQQRAAFVAALRELAHLIESDVSLPVPFPTRVQAAFYSAHEDGVTRPLTHAEKLSALRTFAMTLGTDVLEHQAGHRTATREIGPISYFVQVNAGTTRDRDRPRVVPAVEDAALIGGAV